MSRTATNWRAPRIEVQRTRSLSRHGRKPNRKHWFSYQIKSPAGSWSGTFHASCIPHAQSAIAGKLADLRESTGCNRFRVTVRSRSLRFSMERHYSFEPGAWGYREEEISFREA